MNIYTLLKNSVNLLLSRYLNYKTSYWCRVFGISFRHPICQFFHTKHNAKNPALIWSMAGKLFEGKWVHRLIEKSAVQTGIVRGKFKTETLWSKLQLCHSSIWWPFIACGYVVAADHDVACCQPEVATKTTQPQAIKGHPILLAIDSVSIQFTTWELYECIKMGFTRKSDEICIPCCARVCKSL